MYVIIVGCSSSGSILAKELAKRNIDVVVIDKDKEAFKKLGLEFAGKTIVGDAFKQEVLQEARITEADRFLALTGDDNVNIVLAQIARKIYDVEKVVLCLSNPSKKELCKNEGVEIVFKSQIIASSLREKIL